MSITRQVNVRIYQNISKERLRSLSFPVRIYPQPKEITQYDAIISPSYDGYAVNIFDSAFDKDKLTVLTNDYELWLDKENLKQEKTVEFNIPDYVYQGKKIPEFGATIDNNILLTQFSMSLLKFREVLSDAFFFWDSDKTLCCFNGESVSKEKAETKMGLISQHGYENPVLLYADDKIQVVQNTCLIYLYYLLGCSYLPIRLMCYKDIAYLRTMAYELYCKVKDIKQNSYFQPEDKYNYRDDFVYNYSDKREILSDLYQKDKQKDSSLLKTRADVSLDSWYPVFYFVFKKKFAYLNEELVNTLENTKTGAVHKEDTTNVLHDNAINHLRGYSYISEHKDVSQFYTSSDNYEIIKRTNILPVSELPLVNFGYDTENSDLEDKVRQELNADVVINIADTDSSIGVDDIDQLLSRLEVSVAYVKPRE